MISFIAVIAALGNLGGALENSEAFNLEGQRTFCMGLQPSSIGITSCYITIGAYNLRFARESISFGRQSNWKECGDQIGYIDLPRYAGIAVSTGLKKAIADVNRGATSVCRLNYLTKDEEVKLDRASSILVRLVVADGAR